METLTQDLTNVSVFRYCGSLSTPIMGKVQRAIENLFQQGQSCIVLNLEHVNGVSTMGIGILIEEVRKSHDLNGDIRLACLSLKLKKAFLKVGALETIKEYPTEIEAIESFLPLE